MKSRSAWPMVIASVLLLLATGSPAVAAPNPVPAAAGATPDSRARSAGTATTRPTAAPTRTPDAGASTRTPARPTANPARTPNPTPTSSAEAANTPEAATTPEVTPTPEATPTAETTPRAAGAACDIPFAAVGASFTEADSPDVDRAPGTYFDQTLPGTGSWAYWADRHPYLRLTGGYARSGAKTYDIAPMSDLHLGGARYLVILLGTNNILTGPPPYAAATADLDRIIANSGLPRGRVLVSLLPPNNPQPARVRPYNDTLRSWGARTGVQIISPAEHMDAGNGTFRPGMTSDGVHLTLAQARSLGESIAAHLTAMGGCELPEFAARAQAAGAPIAATVCGLADGGCSQRRERGTLFRSASSPARLVGDSMLAAWTANGREAGRWGYPTGDTACGLRQGGCWQEFRRGSAYAYPGGNGIVTGAIRDRWRALGYENGWPGYPRGAEICGLVRGGCFQRFEGASIYWSPRTGAHAVRGVIAQDWGRSGWERGPFGYPTSSEFCGLRAGGCATRFENAILYWNPVSGSSWVRGAILDHWGKQGFESGWMGYALGGETCGLRDGGCFQRFQSGSIYWTSRTGAHTVRGLISQAWAQQGWERGPLGYPRTDEICGPDGCHQDFDGGRLVWQPGQPVRRG